MATLGRLGLARRCFYQRLASIRPNADQIPAGWAGCPWSATALPVPPRATMGSGWGELFLIFAGESVLGGRGGLGGRIVVCRCR